MPRAGAGPHSRSLWVHPQPWSVCPPGVAWARPVGVGGRGHSGACGDPSGVPLPPQPLLPQDGGRADARGRRTSGLGSRVLLVRQRRCCRLPPRASPGPTLGQCRPRGQAQLPTCWTAGSLTPPPSHLGAGCLPPPLECAGASCRPRVDRCACVGSWWAAFVQAQLPRKPPVLTAHPRAPRRAGRPSPQPPPGAVSVSGAKRFGCAEAASSVS